MEPISADLKSLRMVVSAEIGATGSEVFGGPRDGALAPFMVIAQLGVASAKTSASGAGTVEAVLNLGLTRTAALDVARQLTAAAGLIQE